MSSTRQPNPSARSSAGGASAHQQGRDLTQRASAARAARQAGQKVTRGQSETALAQQAKAWEAGSVGEARAQRKLDLLRRYGHTVLHDVLFEPGKPWNLDHLVIGPSGVFFIDAKNWRGHVWLGKDGELMRRWFAGRTQGSKTVSMNDEVRKVSAMAAHASVRFGSTITPVICLAGSQNRHFEGVAKSRGVLVVGVEHVLPWLRDATPVLTAGQVAAHTQVAAKVFRPAVPAAPEQPWVRAMRG